MAEFKEVAKQYARMCTTYEHCGNCPINVVRDKAYVCRYWALVVDPEKAEEVILQWAKEHPPVTNRDKFKEVFGFDPIADRLDAITWFAAEYKEPEKR